MAFYEGWFKGCDWKQIAVVVVVLVVIGGVLAVLLIAFAFVYPPKATVDTAVLRQFTLSPGTTNSTVSYDVTATLSLRNPNMYRTIKYRPPLSVSLAFNGTGFGGSAVPPFEGKAWKTTTSNVALRGADQPVKLDAPTLKAFRAANETGAFNLDLRLEAVMQYKGRKARCPLVVVCPLKMQLAGPAAAAATAFQKTKCTVLHAKKSGC